MDRLFNTRLQSSLVWNPDPAQGLVPDDGFVTRPITGSVPAMWRTYLRAHHLNEYYRRIVDCVDRPVELETRAGLRRACVLGSAVFETDANGFVKVYLWTRHDGEFGWHACPSERIALGDTPHGWTWLEMFRMGFVVELARDLRCDEDDLQAWSRWVFTRFRRRLARERNLRHMRERIRAALALCPLAVQVARRIRLGTGRHFFATLREYNHAIAHLSAYRVLQKEAPNLVPLYAAHAEALDGWAQPAQQLKERLASKYGIGAATWALAHRARPRWLYPMNLFCAGAAADATADLLRLMQVLGCRQAPPSWYWWDLLQVFGNDRRREDGYARRYALHGRAVRRLTALIEAADDTLRLDMRTHVYDVLAWIVDEDAQNLRGIARAGWKWFKRHAAEWRALRARQAAATARAGRCRSTSTGRRATWSARSAARTNCCTRRG